MGLIVAKFRKKKSTYEVLESLEEKISSIEEFGRDTEKSRKKIVFRFLFFAIVFYLILATIIYFNYAKIPTNWKIYSALFLLLAVPVLILLVKRFLTWYYNRKLRRNQEKLVKLKDEKKKIIDNVMETETYKVAKKILDKFAVEERKIMAITPVKPTATPLPGIKNQTPGTVGLRQRIVPPVSLRQPVTQFRGRESFGFPNTPNTNRALALPSTPLPRTILSRDRSVFDKMVDYLVGDGPSNRFALICNKCYSHNGMALKEEFEYFAFKCCYCGTFNPARKQRLSAPKLELEPISTRKESSSDETSQSEKESDASDVESDDKPKITEITDDLPSENTDESKMEIST